MKWIEIEWDCFCETQMALMEAGTLSGLEAIRNVFAMAAKRNLEIIEFNPLMIWDLRYLAKLTSG